MSWHRPPRANLTSQGNTSSKTERYVLQQTCGQSIAAMQVALHNWEGQRAFVMVLSAVSCPLPLNLRRTAFQLVAIALGTGVSGIPAVGSSEPWVGGCRQIEPERRR